MVWLSVDLYFGRRLIFSLLLSNTKIVIFLRYAKSKRIVELVIGSRAQG